MSWSVSRTLDRKATSVDNPDLLTSMMRDEQQQKPIYKAGPFWRKMAEDAARKIDEIGIADFRGSTSIIGWGFADIIYVDVRVSQKPINTTVSHRLFMLLPAYRRLANLFEKQVALAATHERWARQAAISRLIRNPRTSYILSKYQLQDTMRFGCADFLDVGGSRYARHYINLLDQHDRVAQHIDFTRIRNVFEIGGGFGANAHILIQNYPNIKKVLYLDIPPNLYVGTQYLKSIYGAAVRDYLETRSLNEIKFREDDDLEILAIAPWQIDRVSADIDLFYNAHSFAEIPEDAVRNYAEHADRMMQCGIQDSTTYL